MSYFSQIRDTFILQEFCSTSIAQACVGSSGRVRLGVGVASKLSYVCYAREEQLGPYIVWVVWEGAKRGMLSMEVGVMVRFVSFYCI